MNGSGGPAAAVTSLRSFTVWLCGWTVLLSLAFSVIGLEEGESLPPRMVFWMLHVGSGLLVLSGVLALIQRSGRLRGPAALILGSGLVGVFAFLPVAIALEVVLPLPGVPEGGDDWSGAAAAEGVVAATLDEFLGMAPQFLVGWLLINAGYLVPRRAGTATGADVETPPARDADVAATGAEVDAAPSELLELLPPAIGTDVVLLSSDLNYLHVHTTLGRTVVLYSLRRAAGELGEAGLQVHRSHWVAGAHVVAVRRGSAGLVVGLDNGIEVPVSRRRQAAVKERFGTDFRRTEC